MPIVNGTVVEVCVDGAVIKYRGLPVHIPENVREIRSGLLLRSEKEAHGCLYGVADFAQWS